MSRRTKAREDLLREATALVPRLLLQLDQAGRSVEVFAGFRSGNALSLYFDSDPVYHFNSENQLRRAFLDGNILKADQGKLVAWDPLRTSGSVNMVRREFSAADQEQLGKDLIRKLRELKSSLAEQQFTLLGQVPVDGRGLERLSNWLESFCDFTVAKTPNVF
ncbi:hypothetical protein [Bythopirellula polymerisocia]|uniref:Uncharacterized protein n=1 Tax=Bythopirellula polymerisocia TaxID=2528003 RepID=A0A5C6D113_9BACT|nr:hypothetical protein [Bythopirellula polymerisocia]TWU28569.1 hypothetical protein Pla144_18600 [Bythopirellula polymerisocia]